MCGCNKEPKPGNTEYSVTVQGKTTTFSSETEARIYASQTNGQYVVKKK
jgi:hypothetical protein